MPLSLLSAPEFSQHVVNGLTLGAIYALIALGYTMVYGILKFINFAHGEVLMAGTYAALFLYDAARMSLPAPVAFALAVAAGMAASAFLGVAVERLAYRPLRNAPRLAPLLSAIGVSIILSNLAAVFFGTKSRRFEYPFDNTAWNLGGVSVTPHQVLVFAVAIVLMAALKVFVDFTRTGKAMRATSENLPAASLMGIDTERIIMLTFAVGSALAAAAGILIAMEYKVYPTMGSLAGMKAFIAAVLGGIGSVEGAMLGGVVLGLLETLAVALLGIPEGLKDTIAFGVLILILLFRPQGILGRNFREKV
jgi:branched-chain amino acid transport system permease protein